MQGLPFLKKKRLPKIARPPATTSRYGFSKEDEVYEHAVDELMRAVKKKDAKQAMHCLKILMTHAMARRGDDDADAL